MMMIETKRLYLREFNQGDLWDLAQMLKDPRVMYAYEHDFSDADVQEWLDRQRARYQKDGFGLWAVIKKEDGDSQPEMVGQAGLTIQPCEGEQVLEIGYLLKHRFWHRGFAVEAAEGCKRYALEQLKQKKIHSIIKADNQPSMRVAEALGMKREKEFTARYYNGDMRHFLYSLEREELFADGDISVRRMEDSREDKGYLLAWLSDPAVLAHAYGEGAPWNREKIEAAFSQKTKKDSPVAACIISLHGKPVGYIQYHRIREDTYAFTEGMSYAAFKGGYGLDLFIGEPELWGRGIGSRVERGMAAYLMQEKGASMVCADPREDNIRSVRCLEKAGFQRLGRMKDADCPDRESILMAVTAGERGMV